ncbi:hypothetical protein [Streptomyces cacaoi]|uniref:hypothetical protein n=1 Tax=Streptomyces cacaoi TaxID=1898 RepID=UPI001FD22151|nr:hypothetical protein [Streptomyces cacaoi]
MQLRSTTASLVAVAAVTALLVSACGGGDGGEEKGSGKGGGIEGAKDGSSRSPGRDGGSDEAASGDFRTSDIELPKDLKLVFDWEKPGDPEKAAALDGAADYMRALMHGTVQQDAKDPEIVKHTVPLQSAREYGFSTVGRDVEDKYSVTGEERYYREKVGDLVDGKLRQVTFCSNQSKLFSKELDTGKVRRTKPSDEDYLRFTLVMQKPGKSGGVWKAHSFELEEKAVEQCEP